MESDGTPWRPLVHVLDICKAIALRRSRRRASASTTRSSTSATPDANYQIREIAEIVGRVFPGCEVTVGDRGRRRAQLPRRRSTKIHEVLPGFRCEWDAELGARQLLEVFSRIGLTEEDFLSRQLHAAQADRVPARDRPDRRRVLLAARRPRRCRQLAPAQHGQHYAHPSLHLTIVACLGRDQLGGVAMVRAKLLVTMPRRL